MARWKRVIKKLRRAEAAAHRVASQQLMRHRRRTTSVSMQMATEACSGTSSSANAVGVLVEVLGADTCEQPSHLPKPGVRVLATITKHYLCWQKRIWWRMVVPSG